MRLAWFLLLFPISALAAPRWEFLLHWPDESRPATLHACSPDPAPRVELLAAGGGAFVRDLRRAAGKAVLRGDRITLSDWQAGECLQVAIDLRSAGQADRYGLGYRAGRFLRVPPTRWLWRPRALDADSRLRWRLPAGWSASLPWLPADGGGVRLGLTPHDWPAQTAFGRFSEVVLTRPGGRLRLAVVPTTDQAAVVADWIDAVTDDLLHAYRRLPLTDAQVMVVPLPGVRAAVPWGQVTRGGGSAVHLFIGAEAGAGAWRDDWTATHEFAHLLHPFMGDAGRWLGEGLASYYQNVLRARSGVLSAEEALARLRAGFERGRRATPADAPSLAEASRARQRGSTMRVYWAGAAFWLEVDVALRRQGDSLDRVLQRFAAAELPSERRWTPEAFMDALQRLAPEGDWLQRYARHAAARGFPDSEPLLRALAAQQDGAAAILRPYREYATTR